MSVEGKPLQEQCPGDDAPLEELLSWAKKARNRIIRDIKEKEKLKYRNKKLKEQLKGQQIHSEKIRSQIEEYEAMFGSGLWNCVKSCLKENGK